MIIDCFTFFNELEMLDARLEYLDDVVDYFVIVESNTTFSGKSKPLNYLPNASRYQKYLHKILYFPYAADLSKLNFNKDISHYDPQSAPWQVEYMQRNHIGDALKFFDKDDIVLMGDLDEIPDIEFIDKAVREIDSSKIVAFEQQMFYYNFSHRQKDLWKGTILTTNEFLQVNSAQRLRDNRWSVPSITGGFHLSYWFSPAQIATKIQSFAHQEYNKDEFTDHNKIRSRISKGIDLFDRSTLISADPQLIPSKIMNIFGKLQYFN
jgi:beta-1,4-mannosyl-glycoprotein beta-1,4-N-acetylglucosaminyltransferase